MSSLCRPIRIGVWGSDGVKRHFLVKRSEDLRQDDRIQRLFALINNTSKKSDMAIATYKVIPLSFDFGLIQWVTGCSTLFELTVHSKPNVKEVLEIVRRKRDEFVKNFGRSYEDSYGNMAADITQSKNAYERALQTIPKYILRDAFVKLAVSPERFVTMRQNYVKSLAPMNIAHWILGIGDRHLSNCLISLQTGSVVGVDFGYSFGIATQLLDVPEMVPFRLTPQILGVLAPHGKKGSLRHLMIEWLEQLCSDSSALLAAMEVFVREPSMNWLQHANKMQKEQFPDNNEHTTVQDTVSWSANIKIDQCKRKLSGVNPSLIIKEDLKSRSRSLQYNHHYIRVLQTAGAKQKDDQISDVSMTIEQQVDQLIKLSTDKGILSVTFSGWVPWF